MNKDYTISFIRLLAMFLIITCHLFQYYDNGLYKVFNVGVQIFLVISGYLYGAKKREAVLPFIGKQLRKILVPYWVFLTFATLMYLAFFPEYLSTTIVVDSFLTIGTIRGIGHLWFIKYILLCYCLVPLLGIIRDRMESAGRMLVAALLAMTVIEFALRPFYLIDGVHLNCFILGYTLRCVEKTESRRTMNVMHTSIIMLAIIANAMKLMIIDGYLTIDSDSSVRFIMEYAHLLFGASIFILLHRFLAIRNENAVLRFSDRYSYHIYLVHQFFILSPFAIMTLTGLNILNYVLAYACSCLGGVLLYQACNLMLPGRKQNAGA